MFMHMRSEICSQKEINCCPCPGAYYAAKSLDDKYSLSTYISVSYLEARLDNAWAEAASDYHGQILGPFHPLNTEHELHGLLRLHLPSQSVLDAGCGVGNLAAWCEASRVQPSHLVGLDSSQEMVNRSLQAGYDRVELGVIESTAFSDHEFDTTLAINSIMPTAVSRDPRRTVRESFLELRRVTKQGGTFVAVLPSFESLCDMASRAYSMALKDALRRVQADEDTVTGDVGFGVKRCMHTLETINAELSAAGFRNLEVSKLYYSDDATRALCLVTGAWDWLVTANA